MGTGLKGLLILAVIIATMMAINKANDNMFGEQTQKEVIQYEDLGF